MSGAIWGGRFNKDPAAKLKEFSDSLSFDVRLWRQEIAVARVHSARLAEAGIIEASERERILGALDRAEEMFAEGTFPFSPSDEDIHSSIERFLTETLGATGAKIHAGRSRNDLVVTDLRLWLKPNIAAIARRVHEVQEALYRLARDHENAVMPGYTHLQRAQPVALAHLLLAHAFALGRDFQRLISAYRHTDVSSLGAAAFSGTSIPVDPIASARDLGFAKVFDNAADAVSSRDFALEFLAASAICASNLSRLGEEIVLWTSNEFGFARLDDAYATGSSIMPQKKNPDIAELTRAKAPRILGHLVHLAGVVKGLPLTYNRDLQEDKEAIFDCADTMLGMLEACKGMLQTMNFDVDRMRDACTSGGLTATDVAERLVLSGMPFRDAHHLVGRLVAEAESAGVDIAGLTDEQLAQIDPSLDRSLLPDGDPVVSAASRVSHGGTAPERVAEQLARLEALMDDEERWLAGFGAY